MQLTALLTLVTQVDNKHFNLISLLSQNKVIRLSHCGQVALLRSRLGEGAKP